MKNIWKFLLLALAAMTLVACPPADTKKPTTSSTVPDGQTSTTTSTLDPHTNQFEKLFLAGANGQWAGDTDKGTAMQMSTADGITYTVTFQADGKNPTPSGAKVTGVTGWSDQYVMMTALPKIGDNTNNQYIGKDPSITYAESGEKFYFYHSTKTEVEALDASGDGLVADANTKLYIKYCVEDGADVTFTFVKKENGLWEAYYTYTATEPKTPVTSIFVDDVAGCNGSFNGWNGGMALDEDNSNPDDGIFIYVANIEEAPADFVEFAITEGANKWAQKFAGAQGVLGEWAQCTFGAGANGKITGLTEGDEYLMWIYVQAKGDSMLFSDAYVYVAVTGPEDDMPELPEVSDPTPIEYVFDFANITAVRGTLNGWGVGNLTDDAFTFTADATDALGVDFAFSNKDWGTKITNFAITALGTITVQASEGTITGDNATIAAGVLTAGETYTLSLSDKAADGKSVKVTLTKVEGTDPVGPSVPTGTTTPVAPTSTTTPVAPTSTTTPVAPTSTTTPVAPTSTTTPVAPTSTTTPTGATVPTTATTPTTTNP